MFTKNPSYDSGMGIFEDYEGSESGINTSTSQHNLVPEHCSERCDICEKNLQVEFVDGKTQMGPWANMCSRCHVTHGYGFGAGKGQRYRRQPDGSWVKVGE